MIRSDFIDKKKLSNDWKKNVKEYVYKVDDDQIVEMLGLGDDDSLARAYIGTKLGYEPKKVELIEVKDLI
jgi:hypothetical protein